MRVQTAVRGGIVILCGLVAAGCGSSTTASTTTGTGPGATVAAGRSGVVWLCRPGATSDPCDGDLATTSVPASGPRTARDPVVPADPPFDCFYVYPTVSTERADNADLAVQPAERAAAAAQARPFSQVCRVFAPMYRQRTLDSLARGLGSDPEADAVAYRSLLAGWSAYLAEFNDGRPVIFLGHSQGAAVLIRLLESQVDGDPALRARMVTAILAGGNVTVPVGAVVGSTFRHLPLCTATGQVGCVIAYSTFPRQPPADSLFGRPGTGVSLQSGQTATAGLQVACVDPAALGGGTGALDPLFPTATQAVPPPPVATPFVTYPGLYAATCRTGDGASWLEVDTLSPVGPRPTVSESLGARWGYHLDDVNLAAGNLVQDVRSQEATFQDDRH